MLYHSVSGSFGIYLSGRKKKMSFVKVSFGSLLYTVDIKYLYRVSTFNLDSSCPHRNTGTTLVWMYNVF